MKKSIILLTSMLFVVAGNAQQLSEEKADTTDQIIEIVEENAVFPGGDQAFFEWVSKHVKYPAIAKEKKMSGYVLANFYVEKDGSIGSVDIVESPDLSLSEEVERVLRGMPQWSPAKVGGLPRRTRFQIPFSFQLVDKDGKKMKTLNNIPKTMEMKAISIRARLIEE